MFLIFSPSALVNATGFSKAINLAPLSMPAWINSERKLGSVQKQNMSGLTARARARASVLVCGWPNLGAAASSRALSMSHIPASSKPAVGVKGGGVMLPAFAHADDDDFVTIHRGSTIGSGHCALSHCRTLAMT